MLSRTESAGDGELFWELVAVGDDRFEFCWTAFCLFRFRLLDAGTCCVRVRAAGMSFDFKVKINQHPARPFQSRIDIASRLTFAGASGR